MARTYELMHTDRCVATIDQSGHCRVYSWQFMPYDLYLEDTETEDNGQNLVEGDLDTLVGNVVNFFHWCASRVLTLDREYAKAILNSIGVKQAVTDRDRAEIALSYHCVSLTDVYWVRRQGEAADFSGINLYEHHLNEALVDIALKGHQISATNRELAQDLSTMGCFPKAWIRREDGFYLLKDGGTDVVRRELLTSKICQCFDFSQVIYREMEYEGQPVSVSRIVSSRERSLVTKAAYEIYALNHDLDVVEECCSLDPVAYYGMNIMDYLVGNTDRHPENWGFLVDNRTNKPVSLYPLMDFNQSFFSYDTLDGSLCQTTLPRRITQREAALEAVERIGLRQIKEIDPGWFGNWKDEARMFAERLTLLRNTH